MATDEVRQRTGSKGQVSSLQGSAATPSVEVKQLRRDKNADILGQAAASPAEAPVIQSDKTFVSSLGVRSGFSV